MLTRAIIALCLIAGIAHADVDKAGADELFRQGRAELTAGNFDKACDLFAQSLRRDPRAVGTLLNLALCNERRGKTATALALYQQALDAATDADFAVQRKAALDKVIALSPVVPILRLQLEDTVTQIKLVIDDKVVTATGELPVDPGRHEIYATAPGRLPYQTKLELAAGEHRALTIPALRVPDTTVIVTGGGPRLYGKLALYSGGALLAITVGVAGYAWRSYDSQFPDHCGGGRPDQDHMTSCSTAGQRATDRARTLGNVATITGILGTGAMVAGAFVLWRTPRARELTVVPTANGAAVSGRF